MSQHNNLTRKEKETAMNEKNTYISANTIVFNSNVDSFNNNTNCNFSNKVIISDEKLLTTRDRKRTNVSNEEFCFVWTKYRLLGLDKICEVLGITRSWGWSRYLALTNAYNGVNLPICSGSIPNQVDAETLNMIVLEAMKES